MESLAPPFPPSHAGISVTDNVRSLLASVMSYVEARFLLARLESKEALRLGFTIAVVALFALLCLIIAYVCSIVALTLWIAHHWWQGQIVPAALIIAGSHLIVVMLCAAYVAAASRRLHLFQATLNEFNEDKQWLQANPRLTN